MASASDPRSGTSTPSVLVAVPWTRRRLRANDVLGTCIPLLLLLLAFAGYRLVVFQVGGYLLARGQLVVGFAYIVQFNLCFIALLRCFFLVYLKNQHSVPPREPPVQVLQRLVPFECDEDGMPTRCFLDDCGGSYRSARTRHCRDCRSCKTLFDHHCPFFASCISSETIKPFILFLGVVIPLIGIAIIPLFPLQLAAVRTVVHATWNTEWMAETWWSHWYSWAGGPIWRYTAALILGYNHYSTLVPSDPATRDVSTPSLSNLLVVVAGAFVFLVACAMITTILLNLSTGSTSIQVERTRRWRAHLAKLAKKKDGEGEDWDPRLRLWIPLPLEENRSGGEIVRVDPGLPLFDMGAQENRRRLLGTTWRDWFDPSLTSQVTDTDFNESVMEQLRLEARQHTS